jgi:hypothetical protein
MLTTHLHDQECLISKPKLVLGYRVIILNLRVPSQSPQWCPVALLLDMQERIGLINHTLNALARKAAPKGPLHGTAAARAQVNSR